MSLPDDLPYLSFKRIKNGYGIQPLGPPPPPFKGGDVHETFGVDEHGNLSDDHVTIRLPGGREIRLS